MPDVNDITSREELYRALGELEHSKLTIIGTIDQSHLLFGFWNNTTLDHMRRMAISLRAAAMRINIASQKCTAAAIKLTTYANEAERNLGGTDASDN